VGDEIITESVAILLTLDERHPEGRLFPPPGSPGRAQALRWMLFLATELYPLVELDDYPERFSGSPETGRALRERAKAITRERWRTLEARIAGPYLLASGFSATDLYITKLAVWQDEAFLRTELPRVHALTETVRARPRLATVWARHIR
jgi:GST-like protein